MLLVVSSLIFHTVGLTATSNHGMRCKPKPMMRRRAAGAHGRRSRWPPNQPSHPEKGRRSVRPPAGVGAPQRRPLMMPPLLARQAGRIYLVVALIITPSTHISPPAAGLCFPSTPLLAPCIVAIDPCIAIASTLDGPAVMKKKNPTRLPTTSDPPRINTSSLT